MGLGGSQIIHIVGEQFKAPRKVKYTVGAMGLTVCGQPTWSTERAGFPCGDPLYGGDMNVTHLCLKCFDGQTIEIYEE